MCIRDRLVADAGYRGAVITLGSEFSRFVVGEDGCTKMCIRDSVVGALFIAETLSVMIQVISFKATGKRVFLMAPIHHHFCLLYTSRCV